MAENLIASYSDIARRFLKEQGVYQYRMKKISEMTDEEVWQCCHCYYEEKHLRQEWRAFWDQFESEYCHCRYLHAFIDTGMCYDLQMIGLGYIREAALPELVIDKEQLRLCCPACQYYCEGPAR